MYILFRLPESLLPESVNNPQQQHIIVSYDFQIHTLTHLGENVSHAVVGPRVSVMRSKQIEP